MSAEPLDILDQLEESARLDGLGVEEEIAADIDAALQIRNEQKRLRRILLTVLDDGDQGVEWGFYHPFESVADEQRIRFCEEVERRLRLSI